MGRPPPSQLLASPPPWAAGAEHVREGGDSAAPGCHQEEGQPLRRRPRLGAEQHPRQGHRQSHRWAPLGMSCGVGGAISSPVLGLLGLLGLLGAFLAASGTEGPSWCWARVLSPLWTSPLPPFDRPRAARGRSGTSSVALPSCTARSWWRMAACLSARPDTLSWLAVPRWERAGGTPPAALGRAAAPPPNPPAPFFSPFLQPRDVTNFTVAGFTPMSPRITSPMHPSGAGECWGGVPEGRRMSPRGGSACPEPPPRPPPPSPQANAAASAAAA